MNKFKLVFVGKLIYIFFIISPSIAIADYGVKDFGRPLQVFEGLTSAEYLFPQSKDGASAYYFIPESVSFLGRKVEVKSYGFESGGLCFLGFGFGSLSDGQVKDLTIQIKNSGYDFKLEDGDMSGWRRIFYESPDSYASLYINQLNELFEARFAISSIKCDKSIAKNKWQTMHRKSQEE